MSLHYSSITGCPTITAKGASQTGKSTAMKVALSIMGKIISYTLKLTVTVVFEIVPSQGF